jgi:hypothetical protein
MGILRRLFTKHYESDVLEILTEQHRIVDGLIAQLEKRQGDRNTVFMQLADNLAAHATVEEKIFYPFAMSKSTNVRLHESVEEHLAIKRVLSDMISMRLDDETFYAKLAVLKEEVQHHAHREEEAKLFPEVRSLFSPEELAGIGNDVLAMFVELMESHPSENVPGETLQAAKLPRP